MNFQIQNIEGALKWLKTCPYEYHISSMQGGFIHLKLFIPMDKKIETEPVQGIERASND